MDTFALAVVNALSFPSLLWQCWLIQLKIKHLLKQTWWKSATYHMVKGQLTDHLEWQPPLERAAGRGSPLCQVRGAGTALDEGCHQCRPGTEQASDVEQSASARQWRSCWRRGLMAGSRCERTSHRAVAETHNIHCLTMKKFHQMTMQLPKLII